MRRITTPALWMALIILCGLLVSCSGDAEVTFVSDGNAYTIQELGDMAGAIPDPTVKGMPVAQAAELRQDALTSLRRRQVTEPLANILTESFPAEARSVPYYAELAKVEGKDAWIVVEVWGSPNGTLDKTRVWAFDKDTSEVIVSTVF